MRRLILSLAGLALIAALGGPAVAQAPVSSQSFRAWRLDCYPPKPKATEGVAAFEGDATARPSCQMQQEIRLQGEPGKVAAIVRVRLFGPQRQPFLLLVLPPNAAAELGVTYAVDDASPFKARIRECTAQECVAALLLDDARLEALRGGNRLTVAFKVGGTSLAMLVALDGFAAAFGGLQAAAGGAD